MLLLYKNLSSSKEDFKEFDKELIYDLNDTIFKIISNDFIKEINFDNEVIKCGKDCTELVFHKLKSSHKKSLDIIFKFKDRFLKGYSKKVRIKVNEESRIFDKKEIEELNEIANISKELLRNNFTKNFSELLFKKFSFDGEQDYGALKERYECYKTIISLANDIITNPKVELVLKEEIKDSSRVKKLNANSARYFTMHPEHWYKESTLMPKPLKILTSTYEENRDIYENRVIKFILYKTIKCCDRDVNRLKNEVRMLKQKISILEGRISTEALVEYDKEYLNEEKKLLLKQYKKSLEWFNNLKSIYTSLKLTYAKYDNIKLKKSLKLSINQKILYDKRYLIIFKLYKNILLNLDDDIGDKIEIPLNSFVNYVLYINSVLCDSLELLGFIVREVKGLDKNNILENINKIEIIGTNLIETVSFKIKFNLYNEVQNTAPIELSLSCKDNFETIKFYTDFSLNIEEEYDNKLEFLYNKYSDDKSSSFIVSFTSIDDLKFKNEECKKAIFKLTSLGNNFISNEDYDRYGNLRKGMMLLSISDSKYAENKFKKLLREKLITLGMLNYCTFCKNDKLVKENEEMFICRHCGMGIAIHKCKNCGESIIKVLNSRKIDVVEEYNINLLQHKNSKEDILKYHMDYELKSNSLSSCYGDFYSNSGGFCNNCGKCYKESKENCIRCNLIN
ncbi:DUF2357 domain-containing protein [Clostridium tarantellae]|uniref:DUF2357 domain-containing protein n=1 Tax=Clostridium tarantellae TaxID=39493 RepID=A0A6I1MMI5_9CLOT|nr:DUF2357 domain-containing protein [Clostridium tarantellae]MPQ43668.1 DUF2357 domain-containing protein [Clostridium tarantellae]